MKNKRKDKNSKEDKYKNNRNSKDKTKGRKIKNMALILP
jgi:hypothetical protein